jgi:general secretion pathway protein I
MRRHQSGFTLLEVIIALTIVGLALGSIFGISASSKRLAYKALEGIDRTLYMRAALNIAQVETESDYPKLPKDYAESYDIEPGDLLEKSPRETAKIQFALEPYYILGQDTSTENALQGWRWKRLNTVR